MMVTNCDDTHNKHLFAKNRISSETETLLKTFANKVDIARRVKKNQAADVENYLLEKRASESSKEYFSAVTLTTHLLRIITTPTSHLHVLKNGTSIYNNYESNKHSVNSSTFVKRSENTSKNIHKNEKLKKHSDDIQLRRNLHKNSLPISTSTYIKRPSVSTYKTSNFSHSFTFKHKKCNTEKLRPIQSAKSTKIPSETAAVATSTLNNASLMKSFTRNSSKTKQTKFQTPRNIKKTFRFRLLPSFKVTSLFSLLTLICLETVLLSTVSNCAKTFYMHWNTSNSIFRIDNTDHIIDVNKGNLAFEFDQVHIICPVYEPGTFENETEKYIIYNVSKVEYETCRITNADPRVIAICDKPQKLMFFTITFRPFTPQPGGLEFLPGNDYYFISTSSKDDLYRRIGGRCSTNNMKVVFKVCCAPEDKNNVTLNSGSGRNPIGNGGSGFVDTTNSVGPNGSVGNNFATVGTINQQHINSIGPGIIHGGGININNGIGLQSKTQAEVNGGTSINTYIDQYNRIPTLTNGVGLSNGIGTITTGGHNTNKVLLPGGGGHGVPGVLPGGIATNIGQYAGHQKTGIRINNVPTSQQHPSHENNNGDDDYNKHPNEVVKNEELTYNSGSSLNTRCTSNQLYKASYIGIIWSSMATSFHSFVNGNHSSNSFFILANTRIRKFTVINKVLLNLQNIFTLSLNPVLIISILFAILSTNVFKFNLSWKPAKMLPRKVSVGTSTKTSYLHTLSLTKHKGSFAKPDTQISNNIVNTNCNKIIRDVRQKNR